MAEHKTTDLSPTNSVTREKVLRIIKHKTLDEEAATELVMSLITEAETKVQKAQLEHIINTKKSTLALRDYSGKHKEDIEVVGVIMLQDMLRQLEDDAALKETHEE